MELIKRSSHAGITQHLFGAAVADYPDVLPRSKPADRRRDNGAVIPVGLPAPLSTNGRSGWTERFLLDYFIRRLELAHAVRGVAISVGGNGLLD